MVGGGSRDWLAIARSVAECTRAALAGLGGTRERGEPRGRGAGGDVSLIVDAVAEQAALDELERLGVAASVLSEERGLVSVGGGGRTRIVLDPVDGSLNAKRGLPFAAISFAVAEGETVNAVHFGYIAELAGDGEWWAQAGGGAFARGVRLTLGDAPRGELEVLALECAHPGAVAEQAFAIASSGAERVRILGGVAAALCLLAEGRVDGVVALRPVRAVDLAAAQLVVREAGGSLDLGPLGLDLPLDARPRARLIAARAPALVARLRPLFWGSAGDRQ